MTRSKLNSVYRYYAPVKHQRFGAWASRHGPLPAAPIEELVVQQIVAALSAPHFVQSVWDRMQAIRPDLSEPQVVLPMRNLATLWRELYPAEQSRLTQLLSERLVATPHVGQQTLADVGRDRLPALTSRR